MGDAESLNAVLDVCEGSQASHEPAITEAALLDVSGVDVLHEGGLVPNLMHTLHGLGHGGT